MLFSEEGADTRAELYRVVAVGDRQFAQQLSAEHQLYLRSSLEVLVAGAVGQVGREPYAAAELFGRAYAYLETGALQSVEADYFGVGTYADVFGVVVASDDGIEDRVYVFIEGTCWIESTIW